MYRISTLIELPTDYIRNVIRLVFTGNNYGLNGVGFEGVTNYLDPNGKMISTEPIMMPFNGEDENAWNSMVPLIYEYDYSNKNDLLVEGVAITAEQIYKLELHNLKKKVAFIGYSNPEKYVQARIDYAKRKQNNYDWDEIVSQGEEIYTRRLLEEAKKEVIENERRKRDADKFEYRYFDLAEKPFDEHVETVLRYLGVKNP